MRKHRQILALRCRAILAWGLLVYLGFQVALVVVTDNWLPELRDPEYGYKLSRLRDRLVQEPGRELIVILGSSRSGYGFRPEVVPDWRASNGEAPIVFNFALTGSGPILELLCVRRLLADGIHPNRLIIEVMPPNLHQEGTWSEMSWLNVNRLRWADMRLLRRYAQRPRKLAVDWCLTHSTPWFAQRFCVMSRFAPGWLPWNTRQDIWLALDRSGWMEYPNTVLDAAGQHRALEFARRHYAPAFADFHITMAADRALRELLTLCEENGISSTLLLMPEGAEFQSWYSPEARAEIDAYLTALSREYSVPLVDARSWLPETAFFDSHHLHPAGAATFTQLFFARAGSP
jgi:hypothetical protein